MKIAPLVLIATAALSLAACSSKDGGKDSLDDALDQRPAEEMRDAAEDAGEAVQEAAGDVKDAAEEAASDLKESADEAGDRIEEKVDDARE